jgi:hypothetical protein
MKKGQGLPITTIVIAALAILVLVILFAITTGKLSIFSGAVSECPGICIANAANVPDKTAISLARSAPTICEEKNFEKELRGRYISSGNVKDKVKAENPLVCDKCCVTTLS